MGDVSRGGRKVDGQFRELKDTLCIARLVRQGLKEKADIQRGKIDGT